MTYTYNIDVDTGDSLRYNICMRHRFDEFNLSEEDDLHRYLELLDSPGILVVDFSSEFATNGNYIVKLHYLETNEPMAMFKTQTNHVEILRMNVPEERRRAEEIYNTCSVIKEVQSFVKKGNYFKIAIHFTEDKGNINTKYYREVQKCLIK